MEHEAREVLEVAPESVHLLGRPVDHDRLRREHVRSRRRSSRPQTGPAELKDADAEEYFKTAVTAGAGESELPKFGRWNYYLLRSLKIAVKLPPGEPGQLGNESLGVYLFWPKDAEGGALFTVTMKAAKLDPTIDQTKAYAAMEKAAKEGQFGANPKSASTSP